MVVEAMGQATMEVDMEEASALSSQDLQPTFLTAATITSSLMGMDPILWPLPSPRSEMVWTTDTLTASTMRNQFLLSLSQMRARAL